MTDFNLQREIADENARQLERLGVWPVECEIPAFLLAQFYADNWGGFHRKFVPDLTRMRHEA